MYSMFKVNISLYLSTKHGSLSVNTHKECKYFAVLNILHNYVSHAVEYALNLKKYESFVSSNLMPHC
jgi:hypothetical protein